MIGMKNCNRSRLFLHVIATLMVLGTRGAASGCQNEEYYDADEGLCRHCSGVCVVVVNSSVKATGTRCQDLCPDYTSGPKVAEYPGQEAMRISMAEGGMLAFLGVLIIIVIVMVIALIVWGKRTAHVIHSCRHKNCLTTGRRPCMNFDDDSESSYIKLSDPVDEVEIVYRVTCL